MANFETWKFDSLVQFARESQKRITELEEQLKECDKDRKDLLAALRKTYSRETTA